MCEVCLSRHIESGGRRIKKEKTEKIYRRYRRRNSSNKIIALFDLLRIRRLPITPSGPVGFQPRVIESSFAAVRSTLPESGIVYIGKVKMPNRVNRNK